MNEQVAIQQLLREKLTEAQNKNASYSLRAFSKLLGIAPGPLCQILSGNRRVSLKMVSRICDALLLDPSERSRLLQVNKTSLRLDSVDHEEHARLTADQFQVISEWYYFAILSLIQTKGFKNDPAWISNRLGIKQAQAEKAIERLFRLGMIEETPQKRIKRCKFKYKTTDEVINIPLRKSHFQNLELGKKSLETDPIEARDFTSVTMPTDPALLPKAKELIRTFEQKISELLMGSSQTTEVYRLCVQLFPLTQKDTRS